MRVGEWYRVRPVFETREDGRKRVREGKCVAVHPKGRFAVLEFDGYWGKVRECFWPEELRAQNRVRKRGER